MALWAFVLEIARFGLFAAAHVFGGSIGAGILVLSLVLRIALLPITIRAARAAQRGEKKPQRLGLLQLPVGIAMYRTIARSVRQSASFLWIRDLTRPDFALALVASGIAGLAVRGTAPENQRAAAMTIGMAITFLFAWRMSAGIALYSIAWSSVSAGEALFLRRDKRGA